MSVSFVVVCEWTVWVLIPWWQHRALVRSSRSVHHRCPCHCVHLLSTLVVIVCVSTMMLPKCGVVLETNVRPNRPFRLSQLLDCCECPCRSWIVPCSCWCSLVPFLANPLLVQQHHHHYPYDSANHDCLVFSVSNNPPQMLQSLHTIRHSCHSPARSFLVCVLPTIPSDRFRS